MKVLLLAICLSVASAKIIFDKDLDNEWSLFKTTYKKSYMNYEESVRRLIFEENVRFIRKHNLEFDMGKHTYRVGVNEFADMTNAEFNAKMKGYKPQNRTGGVTYMAPTMYAAVPDAVDWRPKGYVTAVKNQGQCGSCWAFSTTGSLEGQTFKKTGKLISLSEQNLVDCSTAEGNQGCQGGLMDNAFNYIKKNGGIDTEKSYPYTGKNGKCQFNPANVGATDTGFVDIKKGNEVDLASAVATVGPISVAIDASHMSFQLYESGVYSPFICSTSQLDHGVLAVGYGSHQGIFEKENYWIVKNSWGATWGMKGYIWMRKDDRNKCGISTSASYPTV